MKMRLIKLFLIMAVSVVALSSCSVVRHNTYTPNSVQLNISMDDLQKLGEVEISVDYSTYLGFIRKVSAINGVAYDGKVIRKVIVPNTLAGNLPAPLKRAMYKVYDEYPEAEYIVVSSTRSEKSRLFLGGETKATATIKVYKFK